VRKVLNTAAFAALLVCISMPLASFAEESEDPTEISGSEQENSDVDQMHSEIERMHKEFSGVIIPPVVMRMGQPRDPNIYVLPTIQSEEGSVTGLVNTDDAKLEQVGILGGNSESTLDPYGHAAIPIDSLTITTATPADEFMDGARIFGLGLAATAVGLSTLTGINTVTSRRRKLRYLKAAGQ
jgi:hypothetical protein